MDTTIPHSPQFNGKAERLNSTLMKKSRALIFESCLDKLEEENVNEQSELQVPEINESPNIADVENSDEEELMSDEEFSENNEGGRLGDGQETGRVGQVKLLEKFVEYMVNLEDEALLTYIEAFNGTEKGSMENAIRDEKQSLKKDETWT
ncbi:hypothetical protein HHI36_001743 [Cryptolaemus montrouzieri]|uniref:Integrase catalytic domain-containing protein n=1 Tax=Cryptolaemus montrouzieri TaxID=559131 RepID=A0ABD2P953_9CUCU